MSIQQTKPFQELFHPRTIRLSVYLFKELSVSLSFRRASSSVFGIQSSFHAFILRLDSSPYSAPGGAVFSAGVIEPLPKERKRESP